MKKGYCLSLGLILAITAKTSKSFSFTAGARRRNNRNRSHDDLFLSNLPNQYTKSFSNNKDRDRIGTTPIPLHATTNNDDNDIGESEETSSQATQAPGDKLRGENGKRPSLHPTIINAISEALLLRSKPSSAMEVSETVQPIEVAIAAGKLASNAIEQRTKSSQAVDGDEDSAFTGEECNLLAGRIVGVVMRWKELETLLVERVKGVSWVQKYGEEGSFGLLSKELKQDGGDGDDTSTEDEVKQRMKDDPLWRMCRAECLYALFLQSVELPTLQKLGQDSLGGCDIDFLDSDRLETLFPDFNTT